MEKTSGQPFPSPYKEDKLEDILRRVSIENPELHLDSETIYCIVETYRLIKTLLDMQKKVLFHFLHRSGLNEKMAKSAVNTTLFPC